MVTSGSYSALNGRFLARAIAARRSRALFYHSYLTAGEFTLECSVEGSLLAPGVTYTAATATTLLPVEIGIDKIEIESPLFAKTGELVRFELAPHTGKNIVTFVVNIF